MSLKVLNDSNGRIMATLFFSILSIFFSTGLLGQLEFFINDEDNGLTIKSPLENGIYMENTGNNGLWIVNANNNGILSESASQVGAGVWGINNNGGWGGYFNGRTTIVGTLAKSAGSFRIDHPLDPENKYLSHSFVESPDMMNIYNGNIQLDAGGKAVVYLPDWFQALNQEFRYQLTSIGGPNPNLYIASEITDNQFSIAGGVPNSKVSWQVTGIRHDPYAVQNRIPVEEKKSENERGYFLNPEVYGKTQDRSVTNRILTKVRN